MAAWATSQFHPRPQPDQRGVGVTRDQALSTCLGALQAPGGPSGPAGRVGFPFLPVHEPRRQDRPKCQDTALIPRVPKYIQECSRGHCRLPACPGATKPHPPHTSPAPQLSTQLWLGQGGRRWQPPASGPGSTPRQGYPGGRAGWWPARTGSTLRGLETHSPPRGKQPGAWQLKEALERCGLKVRGSLLADSRHKGSSRACVLWATGTSLAWGSGLTLLAIKQFLRKARCLGRMWGRAGVRLWVG